ncbi:MAG TPA: 1-(5-phosphoribosyl)-5-[(5-phosphoribosylamino)methylideneamino]imidazole-4-carboxamide isomerase [Bacillota bacterium]|nr:1-(5-phosphoribosyl)-5-[(5-phosphoribosylamino)methylideneamino]imidazole-4-carboxamide isomerase [Bacillota bacterium]
MQVIPALDLRGGRCVRLYQGDPKQETVYSDDPVEVARQWEKQGARLLHVVDLDGAFKGSFANLDVVSAIEEAVSVPLQVGGGVRSRAAVEAALAAGASRVILGTAAVERPDLCRKLAREYGSQVLVGIDARDGMVAVRGWTEASSLPASDLALRVEQWGIREIIYTDIRRDGTLSGPNLESLEELLAVTSLDVIISGGVSSLQDLQALKSYAGRVRGVIVGQALYTRRFSLAEAIKILSDDDDF